MEFPRLTVPRVSAWRTPDDLQVGGPDSTLVLTGVSRGLVPLIGLLDGHHSRADLEAAGPGWVDWLLATLAAAGVLADGPEPGVRLAARLHGTGPLADRLAVLLAEAGATPRGPEVVHIVTAPMVEVDRVLATELLRRRLPHLVVRVSDRLATVGPFVRPGRTSCLTCEDLTRRGLDPTWPVQVFQWSSTPTEPGPLLVAWAAATALGQLAAYAAGQTPETTATTLEFGVPGGRLAYRSWPRRRDCPCARLSP